LRSGTAVAYAEGMRVSLGIVVRGCLALGVLPSLVDCSGNSSFQASANVAGNYTVSVTNADNGCMIASWDVGKSTSDIPFMIDQQDENLTGTLQGLSGLALDAAIGTNSFTGSATGNDFDITAFGKKTYTQGNCSYKLNAEISGNISGDAITGTIKYSPATDNNPDCTSLQCSSTQNFNGTRPPS
jgi:hypothetical protein